MLKHQKTFLPEGRKVCKAFCKDAQICLGDSEHFDIFSDRSFSSLTNLELHAFSLVEMPAIQGGFVDEQLLAVFLEDEAIPFLWVKPLDGSLICHG